jgi:hypothetical protein
MDMVADMKIRVPTTLTEAGNKRFRELYLKHFDEEITVEEANQEAYRLFSFFALVIEHYRARRK